MSDDARRVQLAAWVSRLRYEDLPEDVIDTTKLRILDVLGLALAGTETPIRPLDSCRSRALSLRLAPAALLAAETGLA